MLHQFISRVLRLCQRDQDNNQKHPFQLVPPGHFYSPIVDPEDMRSRSERIWNSCATMPGIDMAVDEQHALLQQLRPYVAHINYPNAQPADNSVTYFYENNQFPLLDAEFLFAFLCHKKPRRVIEVGSGFSSLVIADVNRCMLNNSIDFTCVEPFPRQFLRDGVDGISQLIQEKVENLELSLFASLEAGDILFIDSSHITKTGSDVNHLFFEVLPSLRSGVIVHVHDIFLPFEYPRNWVVEDGRNWNEQYLLRSFMQFNSSWKIVWMAYYMGITYSDAVKSVFQKYYHGSGGSFWMQRM